MGNLQSSELDCSLTSSLVSSLSSKLDSVAERLIRHLAGRSLYLAAAESCTGGLVADALTRIPGASTCFWGSFVCYTSQAKNLMLGVGEDTLNKYGEVSKETARLMALGALEKSGADTAVSITGLAGPGGAAGKQQNIPVGTVWIAAVLRDIDTAVKIKKCYFSGSRNEVRTQAAREALVQITELLETRLCLM